MSAFNDFADKLFAPKPAPPPPPLFDQLALKTADIIGYISIALIIIGTIATIINVALTLFGKTKLDSGSLDEIRLKLGYFLLIALGFLIAKEIILTVFNPSIKDIFRLIELVVIAFVLHFFLHKETKSSS